jgi:DNA (cytosine-5)-methyltransferase 1
VSPRHAGAVPQPDAFSPSEEAEGADGGGWSLRRDRDRAMQEGVSARRFYEFFAGAGMARAGLGPKWTCLFANEFDAKKGAVYNANWPSDLVLKIEDVAKLTVSDLPNEADLVWASFPCQDLSLAGACAGLEGDRSGTYWPFWRLMEALIDDGRAPKVIVLENVCGMLTSHDGRDFRAVCSNYAKAGYYFGALVLDAVYFVPQSRPRLFIVGVRQGVSISESLMLREDTERGDWHPRAIVNAYESLPPKAKEQWVWWRLPSPAVRNSTFADLVEDDPIGVDWHLPGETARLLKMMSEKNLRKVDEAKRAGRRLVGAVYKRTRHDAAGRKVQRAEIRFDDVAGCLRTPAGGSSRQVIMIVEGNKVRSRLISPRETARLMGLPDDYTLPNNYNEAYHLTGDGVAVPVVRHLAEYLLEPVLSTVLRSRRKVAA